MSPKGVYDFFQKWINQKYQNKNPQIQKNTKMWIMNYGKYIDYKIQILKAVVFCLLEVFETLPEIRNLLELLMYFV